MQYLEQKYGSSRVVLPLEADFPQSLRTLAQPPACLYYRGLLPPPQLRIFAIVGARVATDYGRETAYALGKALAEAGAAVVSGMAQGVDTAAHWGALDGGGQTYAVLGNGLDICYPTGNLGLYEAILKQGGAVLSEYASGMPPLRQNFVRRNRLIAGLAEAVFVLEARERSGSLITAGYALEQGKDIFALPGQMGDAQSMGCNLLIRDGAQIMSSFEDIFACLGLEYKNTGLSGDKIENALDKNQKIVYSCLDFKSSHLDEISLKSGFEMQQLLSILTELELFSLIETAGPGCYRKKVIKR